MKKERIEELYEIWLQDDSRKTNPTTEDAALFAADDLIEDLMQQLNFTDEQKILIADLEDKALTAGFFAGYMAAQREQVPFGEYAVNVNQLKVTTNERQILTAVIEFEIRSGEYQGQTLTFSRTLDTAFNVMQVNDLVKDLASHLSPVPEIRFISCVQYLDLLHEVEDLIYESKHSFMLHYTPNGFDIAGTIVDQ